MADTKKHELPEKVFMDSNHPTWRKYATVKCHTANAEFTKEYILKSVADKSAGEAYGKGYNEGYGQGYDFAKDGADKTVKQLKINET